MEAIKEVVDERDEAVLRYSIYYHYLVDQLLVRMWSAHWHGYVPFLLTLLAFLGAPFSSDCK